MILKEGSGLFSFNEGTSHYFISTHYPIPANYGTVRTACVRSLSCEISPGREGKEEEKIQITGPVVFSLSDDNTKEWTLSYMFQLRDSKARGEARWYSFLCLLDDPQLLVNSMELLAG